MSRNPNLSGQRSTKTFRAEFGAWVFIPHLCQRLWSDSKPYGVTASYWVPQRDWTEEFRKGSTPCLSSSGFLFFGTTQNVDWRISTASRSRIKRAEMKLNSTDWFLDSSKYRLLPVSRFLGLLKFISRAFCVAGIVIEEQGEDCLQNWLASK